MVFRQDMNVRSGRACPIRESDSVSSAVFNSSLFFFWTAASLLPTRWGSGPESGSPASRLSLARRGRSPSLADGEIHRIRAGSYKARSKEAESGKPFL